MLGSRWSSNVLAYMDISHGLGGKIDTRRARALTTPLATAGDAYAQYILAWTQLIDGDRQGALENMKRAGVQLFPPAALDLALYVWLGVGLDRPDPPAAVRLLSHASALGHANTLQTRCVFYRSGKFGIGYELLGYFLTPFAWMRYAFAALGDPFCAEVLEFSPDGRGSVFRSDK